MEVGKGETREEEFDKMLELWVLVVYAIENVEVEQATVVFLPEVMLIENVEFGPD